MLAEEEALQLLRVSPTVAFVRTEHPVAGVASWLLPTSSMASFEGTYTSSTGAVQRVEAAYEPPGEVRRTAHGGMSPAVPTLAQPYGPPAEVRPLWFLLTVLARELGATAISLPDVAARSSP